MSVVVTSGRLHLTAAQVAGLSRALGLLHQKGSVSEFTQIRTRWRIDFEKVWFRSVRFH